MKLPIRCRWRAALVLALSLSGCDFGGPIQPEISDPGAMAPLYSAGADVIRDRYIVVFKREAVNPSAMANQLVSTHGGSVHFAYSHALKGFAATLPAKAVDAIRRNRDVSYVIADAEMHPIDIKPKALTTQPGAPWGLDRIDQRALPMNTTYTYEPSGVGVSVYVIDTGIRTSHSEFSGRAVVGADLVGDGGAGQDCSGHGTHVAGSIGGSTFGVAKAVNLVSVRVFPCSGGAPNSTIIAAVDWVTQFARKPAVVNMSLGGPVSGVLDDAIRASIATGVSYVVAAGNENVDACNVSPARIAEVITVGAVTASDTRSSFSNWGSCVDVFAPGSGITSAWYTDDAAINTLNGTSMAAPHAAGVAALYLQANPNAAPVAVSNAILSSASRFRLSGIGTNSPNLLLFAPLVAEAPAAFMTLSQASLSFSLLPGEASSSVITSPVSSLSPLSFGPSILDLATRAGRAANAIKIGGSSMPKIRARPSLFETGFSFSDPITPLAAGTVTLTNEGNATLTWTASIDRPWLSISSTSGVLAAGQSTQLEVRASALGLTPGTYTGSLIITGPAALNSPRTIPVALSVVNAQPLPRNSELSGLGDVANGLRYYAITVPVGAAQLAIHTSGGTGDLDLYVERGTLPSFSRYMCRPWLNGNSESCIITAPNPGTWYVMLHGFNAYSGARIVANLSIAPRLVWQNTTSGERGLWPMNPTWTGQYISLPTLSPNWRIVASADFDADADDDLLWQNSDNGQRVIWFMDGAVFNGSHTYLPTVPREWDIATAADFTADACPDLVWQNPNSGTRVIWVMDCGSYTPQSVEYLPTVPGQWDIAGAADFNQDMHPDLVWQNTLTGERVIWFMTGPSLTGQHTLPSRPASWRIAVVADLTFDGLPDIVWQNILTGERFIWPMVDVTWSGVTTPLPTVPVAWEIVGFATGG